MNYQDISLPTLTFSIFRPFRIHIHLTPDCGGLLLPQNDYHLYNRYLLTTPAPTQKNGKRTHSLPVYLHARQALAALYSTKTTRIVLL